MLTELTRFASLEVVKIGLVLVLAFFIGLEREEHKQRDAHYAFGGIRTFPLIGLVSYTLALISAPTLLPWALGLLVIGALMLASYLHKLNTTEGAGITSELSALATYVVGALVYREQFWIAGTVAVLSLFLLELKAGLEGLAQRVAPEEILTVTKFLLLTVVILPIVPNQEFTSFHINPFKLWLVVVAVSGISFASYLLQRALKARGGVLIAGLLGGAYSSTATTVALAKRSQEQGNPNLFSGSILAASGVMYLRLVILVAFFNGPLAGKLAPGFVALSLIAIAAGWLLARRSGKQREAMERYRPPKNPLQLKMAFLFGLVFLAIMVLTALVRQHLGRAGLYLLAAVAGVADVDPFILGLAQVDPSSLALVTAASAVVIAAAFNNAAKAAYALSFADRATGRRSGLLLMALAALGLAPLVWI